MKNILLISLLFTSFLSCAQSKVTTDEKLLGKWKVLSKIETDKTNGVITEQDTDLYTEGEKTYEFTKKNTVIIIQGHGKHREELPVRSQGDKLFIGKYKANKTPYIVSYEEDHATLLKTETKTKKGKTVVETEEVSLQR